MVLNKEALEIHAMTRMPSPSSRRFKCSAIEYPKWQKKALQIKAGTEIRLECEDYKAQDEARVAGKAKSPPSDNAQGLYTRRTPQELERQFSVLQAEYLHTFPSKLHSTSWSGLSAEDW